jgi:hypothetical protein
MRWLQVRVLPCQPPLMLSASPHRVRRTTRIATASVLNVSPRRTVILLSFHGEIRLFFVAVVTERLTFSQFRLTTRFTPTPYTMRNLSRRVDMIDF